MPAVPSRRTLVQWFEDACVDPADCRVGLEWEKEPVHLDGTRVSFEGLGGVEAILGKLAERHGWEPHHEGGRLIALARDGATVTLEPGGQIELSTATHQTLQGIEREVRRHLAELQDATRGTDTLFLQTGFTPLSRVEDIAFVPKARYRLMAEQLARSGALAHSMMKGTTSVQVALDYTSEADCAAKMTAALGLSPIVTALAANSPLRNGAPAGVVTFRSRCWQSTDPSRTGLLGDVLEGGFTFARWVDWILDVPMMFYRRDGAFADPHGCTFGRWITDGIDGVRPTMDDFELHLTSVFPEVRLKNFIELRGADNGPLPQVLGIAALWKGLLYDDEALAEAGELAAAIPLGRRDELLDLAIEQGLAGRFEGRSLRAWAGYLLEIASAGLSRQAPDGPAEAAYLAPLIEQARRGESPATATSAAFAKAEDPREFLVEIAYPAVARIPPVDPSAGAADEISATRR